MNKIFKRNAIGAAIASGIVTSLVSLPMYAEESTTINNDRTAVIKDNTAETSNVAKNVEIEVISITGTRQALELALDNKRNSDSIMDGIAADGIGEFPDLNLADTISRITGVQLDTSGPGGERREGQISLRGLPNKFAKTVVNGQTLATPNFSGGFAFGVFENSVISAVNIIKSPTAKHDEGGLSGIVDIRTKRPLEINKPFVTLAAQFDYEESSEDIVPKYSLSAATKLLDDTFGLFGSMTWSDQSFRTDSARINGYNTEDINGDGLADLYTPNEARYNSRYNDGDRLSIAGGIEYQLHEDLKIGLTGLSTQYNLLNQFDQLRVQDARSIEASNLIDGGVYGSTYSQAIFRDTEIDAENRHVEDEYGTYGLTGDIVWTSDDWKISGVAHYSAAKYDRVGYQVRRNIRDANGSNMDVFVNTGAGKIEDFGIHALNGDDWSDANFYSYGAEADDDDPENQEWRQRFISATGYDLDETEKAFQVDVVRYFDSFITSVEGGVKLRQFQQSQSRPSWTAADLDFSEIDDLGVMRPSISQGNGGFFGGDIGGIDYLVSDYYSVKEGILNNPLNVIEGETFGDMPARIDNSSSFSTDKNIAAAYMMARFDFDRFDFLAIRGNVGVRHIYT
jgi:TonB-dependent receptor